MEGPVSDPLADANEREGEADEPGDEGEEG